MREEDLDEVVSLIRDFGSGARKEPLTWELLASLTGRSERNLRRYDAVYEEFWLAKEISKTTKPSRSQKESAAINDLKRRLRLKNDELASKDEEINRWRQKFVRLIVNGEHEGVDVRRLWSSDIPIKAT
jgi:hypothetical protein